MAVIGIEITEVIQTSQTAFPDGFICCHMPINAEEGVPDEELNVGQLFNSYTSFAEKFIDASDLVRLSVKAFFDNYAQGRLWIYPSKSDNEESNNLVSNLEFCMGELGKNSELELGFLVIPEFYLLETIEDITSIYSAAESLASFQEWISLIGHTANAIEKDTIIEERKPFVSTLGHSAYYGSSVVYEGITIPITSIVAAIGLRRSSEETVFSPPGGARYPIQGITDVIPYFSTKSDYTDLKLNDINIVQKIPNEGYCIWGARTLAADDLTDNKFGEINSRMAVSITIKRLEVALTPLLFDSIDPDGYLTRDIIRTIRQTMNQIYQEGGLSGEDVNSSYRVEEITEDDVNENLKRVTINIYARFVRTLEEIKVTIVPTNDLNIII